MMKVMRQFWTGVGSRETPPDILLMMELIGKVLTDLGYILRSGGAEGADTAFYAGCKKSAMFEVNKPIIYISWNGMDAYGKNWYHDPSIGYYNAKRYPTWNIANEMAFNLRGSFERLGWKGIAHHTRNVFQVIGDDLHSPSNFLICWARPKNKRKPFVHGGTATAVKLAYLRDIEIYNLYHPQVFNRFVDFLDKYDEPHPFEKKVA